MRVLVAIASYGDRNLGFLRTIIQRYQAMSMAVDIVVLSEAPKEVPAGVRVAVGLPSSNPWSLPFAHKPLFAENIDRYDLFIYSEDDIGVTEANIRAFVDATRQLKDDEVAGFLRYETAPTGATWMPDVHSMFRWDPGSIVRRDGELFARYSNEHAAFYILTRDQLKRAIASGGFLREPYEGKYDMLCAAATDPYTSCGLRKMVCTSNLEPFLIHHMSDRYAGQMGLPLDAFKEQLATLEQIARGHHPSTTLCEVESRMVRATWSKDLYERPHDALLGMVPASARTVLSIGCGWGGTEEALRKRGADVTALPLDSVIGAAAAKRGVATIYGSLDDCLELLSGRSYDCVLITNLLHLQQDPAALFARCTQFVRKEGVIVVDAPNFRRVAILLKQLRSNSPLRSLGNFAKSGISPVGPSALKRPARTAGFSALKVRWYGHSLPKKMGMKRLAARLGMLTAEGWVLRAERSA